MLNFTALECCGSAALLLALGRYGSANTGLHLYENRQGIDGSSAIFGF